MKEIRTYATISGGVLKLSHRETFNQAVEASPDGRYVLILQRVYNRRSLQQNAYMHGVLFPEIRLGLIDNGYSPAECTLEAVKDLLKSMFAKKELVNEKTGEILTTVQPTSQMSTSEMMDFWEECRRFSQEFLGRYIPAPGEQVKLLNI